MYHETLSAGLVIYGFSWSFELRRKGSTKKAILQTIYTKIMHPCKYSSKNLHSSKINSIFADVNKIILLNWYTMANTSKKKKTEKTEVIANCDHLEEPVTNCDQSIEVIANCDNLRSLKFYPSLPYAYTEQGIGQLIGLCAITKMQTTPETILDLLK